ncbi:hypothetical protein [Tropicimonas sp. S265A]|uniref:hypothetical protein n=1 Tax=Tropicimonas sp. S265A TaxID=3415134 RepID=UPI003C7E54B5
MSLLHFGTPREAIIAALDEHLCDLKEERAAAIGTKSELYSDAEYEELEDKISDLKQVLSQTREAQTFPA